MSGKTTTTDDATEEGSTTRFDLRAIPIRHYVGGVGLVLLYLLPFFVEPITTAQFVSALYFAMFVMSWDVVSGYTGEISFGHAFFFAIGGYGSALLNVNYGLDPLLSIPGGMLLAAIAGILIGVPALRLHGPYLSLVTLVAPLLLLQLFIYRGDIFGGETGFPGNPAPFIESSDFGILVAGNYYIALALFTVILGVLLLVTRSNAGAVFTAIREDPDAVAAAGINVAKFKIFAFVLSGAVGGLAGAAFVHSIRGGAQPTQLLDVLVSVEVIVAAILGGMGTIVGAAIGGMFFFLFSDWLDDVEWVLPLTETTVGDANFLVFAVITLFLLFYFPGGLLRGVLGVSYRLKARLTGDDVAADGGRTTEGTALGRTLEKYRSELRSLRGRVETEETRSRETDLERETDE